MTDSSPLPPGMKLMLRTIAMPADTNPAGDIFGGWIMSRMDIAASVRANELSDKRTVTVAVNNVEFRKPMKVGDTLSIYTDITKIGRTSATFRLEAWVHRGYSALFEQVATAEFVMVAVDDNDRPTPIRSSEPSPAA